MAARRRVSPVVASLISLAAAPAWATNGHVVHGVGPKNEALGGAGTATEDDLLGSLAWNPAGAHWLSQGTTIDLSVTYFRATRYVYSEIDADTFGPGIPAGSFGDRERSKTPVVFLGAFGVAHRLSGGLGFHFGLLGKGGFGIEYGQSTTNPILTPQPPSGFGFGRIKSDFKLLQLPLGLSWGDGKRFSVGLSLVPSVESLWITPAPFARPNDANGDGFATYPRGEEMGYALGIGGQVGCRVVALEKPKLAFGLSYATPIFFQRLEYDIYDEVGNETDVHFHMDFPAIASFGASFEPLEGTLLAFDARWINYSSTRGFHRSGFDEYGAVKGFGWRDIWVVGIGLRQKVTEWLDVRVGYNYCEDPIPDRLSFYNIPSPAVVQHHFTAGFSVKVSDLATIHFSYFHAFEEKRGGNFVHPQMGPIPGARVASSLAEDAATLGVTLHF